MNSYSRVLFSDTLSAHGTNLKDKSLEEIVDVYSIHHRSKEEVQMYSFWLAVLVKKNILFAKKLLDDNYDPNPFISNYGWDSFVNNKSMFDLFKKYKIVDWDIRYHCNYTFAQTMNGILHYAIVADETNHDVSFLEEIIQLVPHQICQNNVFGKNPIYLALDVRRYHFLPTLIKYARYGNEFQAPELFQLAVSDTRMPLDIFHMLLNHGMNVDLKFLKRKKMFLSDKTVNAGIEDLCFDYSTPENIFSLLDVGIFPRQCLFEWKCCLWFLSLVHF